MHKYAPAAEKGRDGGRLLSARDLRRRQRDAGIGRTLQHPGGLVQVTPGRPRGAGKKREERRGEKQSICTVRGTGAIWPSWYLAGSLPDADAGGITDGTALVTRYLPWWPGDLAGLCHRALLAAAPLLGQMTAGQTGLRSIDAPSNGRPFPSAGARLVGSLSPLPVKRKSMARPTARPSRSAKDRQRAGGRQSIPATGCLPSTGHSRRLAGPPPKRWVDASSSQSQRVPSGQWPQQNSAVRTHRQ